jgi:CRP-like cAMP-binding protein
MARDRSPTTPSPRERPNLLVASLPQADRERLLARGEPVRLEFGEVLREPGQPTRHVYFPTDSVIAQIASVDGHPGLEVGMIGCEGMLGSRVGLGSAREPFKALVQGAGLAWRVALQPFRAELAASAALRRTLGRYVSVLMTQRAHAAVCLRYHEIGPRLARWLLMSVDRAGSDRFRVTHEFLAGMLGVRRVGVTVAAGELQRHGLITYHRGELSVLDREGLERAACSCYESDRQAYAHEMRAPPGPMTCA